jgi:hypothetical protein
MTDEVNAELNPKFEESSSSLGLSNWLDLNKQELADFYSEIKLKKVRIE